MNSPDAQPPQAYRIKPRRSWRRPLVGLLALTLLFVALRYAGVFPFLGGGSGAGSEARQATGGAGAPVAASPTGTKPAVVVSPVAVGDEETPSPSPSPSPSPLRSPATEQSPAAQPTAESAGTLPLSGRRIGIDPGHGPREDLGAVLLDPKSGKLVLTEAEINLDVALRTRDLLEARGASVTLTRENADTFTAPWPVDANGDGTVGDLADDLQERIDILNNSRAEVFLSIHANSAPRRPDHPEVQVFYCAASDCAFPEENKRLGLLVVDELKAELGAVDYPIELAQLLSDYDTDPPDPPQHLFILGPANPPRHARGTLMPGVLSESFYITVPGQAELLKRDNVRQAIARAYADALETYLTTTPGEQQP